MPITIMRIFAAFIAGLAAGPVICVLSAAAERGGQRRVPGAARKLAAALCFASAGALLAWRFSSYAPLLFSFVAFAFLLFHSLTDIDSGSIYDLPVVMMAAAGLLLRSPGGVPALADGLLGAAAGFLAIHIIRVVSRGGMGSGDATLMLGAGALLGWRLTLLALYCGFLAGGLFVIPMLLMKKMGTKDAVPLAPFLAAGCFVSILAGEFAWGVFGYSLVWPWAA